MNHWFASCAMEVSCVIHPHGKRVGGGGGNVVGDAVLQRLRLALAEDALALVRLVPGCRVCRACCAMAMRALKRSANKRPREEEREKEEEAPLVLEPLVDDVTVEVNALFAVLGYPRMAGEGCCAVAASLWSALSTVAPTAAVKVEALLQRKVPPVEDVVGALAEVPPRAVLEALAGDGEEPPRPENALFVGELVRSLYAGGAHPGLFDTVVPQDKLRVVLSHAARSPFVRFDGEQLCAALWTRNWDPPTLVVVEGVARGASVLDVRAALARQLCVPRDVLRIDGELTDGKALVNVLLQRDK